MGGLQQDERIVAPGMNARGKYLFMISEPCVDLFFMYIRKQRQAGPGLKIY